MAGNQLSPPAPFPAIRGDPPVPWHRWFQSFHTYLVAYGLDDKSVSDTRRREILLHCRSTEGQRVFSSFNASSDSHEETTATLYRHFGPKHSIIMSRCNRPKFNMSRGNLSVFTERLETPSPLGAQSSSERSGRSSGKWCTNYGSGSVSRYHRY